MNKVCERGSIRKAPDVITWTIDLAKLRAAGDKDAGTIIKAWNMEASRQQQLLGAKAQTLNNVLNLMPQEILDRVVIPAVRELGWENCPWTDESFAAKRIFPGAAPPLGVSGLEEPPHCHGALHATDVEVPDRPVQEAVPNWRCGEDHQGEDRGPR